MILTVTLLCDRKKYFQLTAVERLANLTYSDKTIYVNIQTEDLEGNFAPLLAFLKGCNVPYHIDVWSWKSSWWEGPRFDQDQARLVPIEFARNMAINAACVLNASHMFQVDADVVVPPDSIERLLQLDSPIVGGMVPGRGAHSHLYYVFGEGREVMPGVVETRHGTAGFMLVQRRIFARLRYRWGPSALDENNMLSEDPAFCEDAKLKWDAGPMLVDKSLIATHHDDPENPLKLDQVSLF